MHQTNALKVGFSIVLSSPLDIPVKTYPIYSDLKKSTRANPENVFVLPRTTTIAAAAAAVAPPPKKNKHVFEA